MDYKTTSGITPEDLLSMGYENPVKSSSGVQTFTTYQPQKCSTGGIKTMISNLSWSYYDISVFPDSRVTIVEIPTSESGWKRVYNGYPESIFELKKILSETGADPKWIEEIRNERIKTILDVVL
jgi:hypothetical protein